MKIGELIKDAIKYPLLDWKKILLLGIVVLFTDVANVVTFTEVLSRMNILIIYSLVILGYLIGFLLNGYLFRIIRSSLTGEIELPRFNALASMFKEGVKVFLVGIVYAIPAILILLVFAVLSFNTVLGIAESNPSTFIANLIIGSGFFSLIAILYMVIIYPLILMAIANMVYYRGELRSAFKVREILNKISILGWGNLVVWYIVSVLIFFILAALGNLILTLIDVLTNPIVGHLLMLLILIPYLYMYFARSAALFYISNEDV